MNASEIDNKSNEFKEFLLKRNPSEKFANKYMAYLNSSLVRNIARKITGNENIFSVHDISALQVIYLEVKKDKANIRLHNIYSGIISAYIKFLSGIQLRKLVIHEKK